MRTRAVMPWCAALRRVSTFAAAAGLALGGCGYSAWEDCVRRPSSHRDRLTAASQVDDANWRVASDDKGAVDSIAYSPLNVGPIDNLVVRAQRVALQPTGLQVQLAFARISEQALTHKDTALLGTPYMEEIDGSLIHFPSKDPTWFYRTQLDGLRYDGAGRRVLSLDAAFFVDRSLATAALSSVPRQPHEPNRALVLPVDFPGNSELARARINEFIATATDRRIRSLIPREIARPSAHGLQSPVLHSASLVEASAVTVNLHWEATFEAQRELVPFMVTDSRIGFHPLAAGKSPRLPIMVSNGVFEYADFARMRLLALNTTQPNLTVLLIIPDEPRELHVAEDRALGGCLRTWLARLQKQSMVIQLPTFEAWHRFDAEYGRAPAARRGTSDNAQSHTVRQLSTFGQRAKTSNDDPAFMKHSVPQAELSAVTPFLVLVIDRRTQLILLVSRVGDARWAQALRYGGVD